MKNLYFKILIKLLDYVISNVGEILYDNSTELEFKKYKVAVSNLYDEIFDFKYIDEVYFSDTRGEI